MFLAFAAKLDYVGGDGCSDRGAVGVIGGFFDDVLLVAGHIPAFDDRSVLTDWTPYNTTTERTDVNEAIIRLYKANDWRAVHELLRKHGEVIVLAASREFKELGRVDLDEKTFNTPTIANGVMYLRTQSRLFSLGKAQ